MCDENPEPIKVPEGMDRYIGCKIIAAKPMDARTFHETVKGNFTGNQENALGYLVIYPDGYKSWSPKNVFEAAYRKVSVDEYALLT